MLYLNCSSARGCACEVAPEQRLLLRAGEVSVSWMSSAWNVSGRGRLFKPQNQIWSLLLFIQCSSLERAKVVIDDHTRKPRAAVWAALPSLSNPFVHTRPCQGLALMPKPCKMWAQILIQCIENRQFYLFLQRTRAWTAVNPWAFWLNPISDTKKKLLPDSHSLSGKSQLFLCFPNYIYSAMCCHPPILLECHLKKKICSEL